MRSNQKVWQRLIHMLAIGAFLAVFSQPASPKIATAQNAPELTWTPMKPMLSGRAYFTATQLPSGKVLVVGGQASHFAEIYDPQKNIWEATSKPNITDFGYLQHHTATLLNDGRVLVTGGVIGSREIGNAMIYDPPENKWTSVRAMDRARSGHTATLLSDGRVLVYGGRAQNIFNIGMEIFSPSTNTWSPIPSLQRLFTANHTATPLKNNTVFITGGSTRNISAVITTTVVAPSNNPLTAMMSLRDARTHHTATTLQDGNILIAGGGPASSELFVPTKRTWDAPSAMHFNRYDATATLLPDGRVLVTGGTDSLHASANILDSTEIYDPWTNTWEASTHLIQPRTGHATVLLPDGSVLVMGGRQGETQSTPLATVERSGSFVPQSKTHCTPGSVVILENDQCSVGLAFSRINTGSGQLSIHATSSDQALIPDSNLVIEGTGTARQLTIKPARTDARSAPTRQGKAVITVEASDGAQTEKLLYPVSVVPPPWLVMLYLNGDDGPLGGANAGTSPSIAPPIKKLLKSLREMPFNPAMRLVVLSDLHDNYGDSRIYVRDPDGLTDVTPQLLHDQSRWPGFAAELDSADPTTVRALIGWARQTYPDSAFSFLSLLDHGGGWAPEFENSPGQPRAFRIRQAGGWRGMSIDYTNNSDSLSTRETSMALQNLNIDVVFFDACLMAMLESAYEIRNDATYLIAGQNLLFAEFPYDDYFSHEHLTPSTEPKDLALTIARRYNKNVDASANPFTISVIDLSELRVGADAHIPSLVNALAATLLAHLPAGAEPIPASDPLLQAIQQAYVNALKFDYDSSLTLDPNDGYVDLRDFTLHLLSNSALPPDVEAAARQLDAAIRGENKTVLEVNAKTGRYLGHRMDFSRSNGLSIYLPLGEQDYRPTLVDPNNPSCPAKPERQLNYYVDPTQLAFTKDYPQWSRLLMRLENNVSTLRSPLPVGCTTGVAVQQTAALVIDKRPFTSPSQLQLVRQTVFLPAVAR